MRLTTSASITISPTTVSSQGVTKAELKASKYSWEGASIETRRENQVNLLNVMTDIHAAVKHALETTEDGKAIPQEQKSAYEGWAEKLNHARNNPDVQFPLEQFIGDMAALTAPLGKTAKAAAPNAQWYGGTWGSDNIFHPINKRFIEPMLKSAIEDFRAETRSLPYDEQIDATKSFLNHLLDVAGWGRNVIARMASSDRTAELGIRRHPNEFARMEDECEKSNYDVWRGEVKGRISSLLTSHPDVKATRLSLPELTELVEKTGTDIGPLRTLQFIGKGETVELTVNHSMDPPKLLGAFYGHPLDITVARYEFECKQDPKGGLSIDNMWCHHPWLDANNIIETAAEDFHAFVHSDGSDKDALCKSVASFIFKIANSSMYKAGQQGVTEQLLNAGLATKNLIMVVSDDWSAAKKNPTYDQQALMLI